MVIIYNKNSKASAANPETSETEVNRPKVSYNINDVIWRSAEPEYYAKYIGKRVFTGSNYMEALDNANSGAASKYKLVKADPNVSIEGEGFTVEYVDCSNFLRKFPFIIVEREPKRKPFDLSDPKVRHFLMGKFIRNKKDCYEKIITYAAGGSKSKNNHWTVSNLSAESLFNDWEFVEEVNGSKVIGTFD